MVALLKAFGKGLLYIIGLPFFILALILFAAIGLFLFIYQIIKSIIYFFTGQKFFPELPEDKELRLKKEAIEHADDIIDQTTDNNQDLVVPLIEETSSALEEEQDVSNTIEEACFKDSLKEEQEIDENVSDDLTFEAPTEDSFAEIKEETLKTEEPKPIIGDEELEEYIPKGSVSTEEIDEEEDTNVGVDIDYDL